MKNKDVLVLNKAFIPIHIIDCYKCMSLIYQETARALDTDFVVYNFSDWLDFSASISAESYPFISTIKHKIAIPEIIVLKNYDKLPERDVKYSRQTVMSRDNYRCYLCGKSFGKDHLTIDHIVPRSKGGRSTWDNTITCCKPCNYNKADMTLEQLEIKPLFKPKKPKWISPINKLGNRSYRQSWLKFLNQEVVDIGD